MVAERQGADGAAEADAHRRLVAVGAGAVLLKAEEADGPLDRGILATKLHADGRHNDLLFVDGGASTTGASGGFIDVGLPVFRVDDPEGKAVLPWGEHGRRKPDLRPGGVHRVGELAGVESRDFGSPDETRTPDKTRVDVVRMGGTTAARLTFEPGWRWSECVKPVVGTDSCQVNHVGYAVEGQIVVRLGDGTEQVIRAGEPRISGIPRAPQRPVRDHRGGFEGGRLRHDRGDALQAARRQRDDGPDLRVAGALGPEHQGAAVR